MLTDLGRPATVAEIGKQRMRLVNEQLASDLTVDAGFRVVKVDTTNMADVLRTPDALGQDQLVLYADNVKPDRTGEDLLFQVLLDWGLELTMPISVDEIEGQEVFDVEDGALIACFGEGVSPELVRKIAGREPLRAVFRDSGFATDADRINAEQVFAEVSPATDVKAI
jgi:adenine-specific DNA-methyltransferase